MKPSQNGWISCICERKHIPVIKQQLRNNEWSFVFIFWCLFTMQYYSQCWTLLSFNKQILKKQAPLIKSLKNMRQQTTIYLGSHHSQKLSPCVSNIFKSLGKQTGFSRTLWVSMAGFCTQANTCYAVYYSLCSWNEYILPPIVIIYDQSSSADVNCNAVLKERSRLNCGCTRLFD